MYIKGVPYNANMHFKVIRYQEYAVYLNANRCTLRACLILVLHLRAQAA